VARSPDPATFPTEGLPFSQEEDTFGQIQWRGQETTPQHVIAFWDSHFGSTIDFSKQMLRGSSLK
jgi:hypothetical protein